MVLCRSLPSAGMRSPRRRQRRKPRGRDCFNVADQRLSGSNGKSKLLPEATRERWQPIRGGLLNIYRYAYMEFRYEAGRLLLRGNNGTGKSRVLALQLPFLLDGEIIPQRVEPDGDTAKRMDWNLLLGKYGSCSANT